MLKIAAKSSFYYISQSCVDISWNFQWNLRAENVSVEECWKHQSQWMKENLFNFKSWKKKKTSGGCKVTKNFKAVWRFSLPKLVANKTFFHRVSSYLNVFNSYFSDEPESPRKDCSTQNKSDNRPPPEKDI